MYAIGVVHRIHRVQHEAPSRTLSERAYYDILKIQSV